MPPIKVFAKLNQVERSIYSFAVWALAAVLIVHVVLHFAAESIGLGGRQGFEDYLDLAGLGGGNNSAYIALSIYYLALPLCKRELAAFGVLALLAEGYFWEGQTVWSFFASWGWVMGCVFTLAIIFRAVRSRQDRARALGLLMMISLMSALSLFTFWTLQILSASHPLVYDAWGLLADSAWGTQPAMKIAQWETSIPNLEHFILFFYVKLAVWQAIATVLVIRYPEKSYNNVFAASVLMGVMAICFFYHLLPMVGIDVVLGGVKIYPFGPKPVVSGVPELMRAPGIYPRTCAPSMHTAWIMGAFFAMCRIDKRFTAVGLVVVAVTLLGTVNRLVGHYLVDLWAAFPLVVAGQAITAWPTESNRLWRQRAGLFGVLACAGFLLFIRWLPELISTLPVLFCFIQFALVAGCVWFERKLALATLRAD